MIFDLPGGLVIDLLVLSDGVTDIRFRVEQDGLARGVGVEGKNLVAMAGRHDIDRGGPADEVGCQWLRAMGAHIDTKVGSSVNGFISRGASFGRVRPGRLNLPVMVRTEEPVCDEESRDSLGHRRSTCVSGADKQECASVSGRCFFMLAACAAAACRHPEPNSRCLRTCQFPHPCAVGRSGDVEVCADVDSQ